MRSHFRCQRTNHISVFWILPEEDRLVPGFEIIELETRRHGRSHQHKSTPGDQAGPLPDARRNHHLRLHASFEITTNYDRVTLSVRMKLEHLHRITKIEVKEFVAGKPVNQ